MGYFLKNRQLQSGSTGVVVPASGLGELPDQPVAGMLSFNSATFTMSVYNGLAWQTLATSSGGSSYVVDTFTGDGTTVSFTMSLAVTSPSQVLVFVGGLYQLPTTSYTTNGTTTLTFTSAPPLNAPINVIHTA